MHLWVETSFPSPSICAFLPQYFDHAELTLTGKFGKHGALTCSTWEDLIDDLRCTREQDAGIPGSFKRVQLNSAMICGWDGLMMTGRVDIFPRVLHLAVRTLYGDSHIAVTYTSPDIATAWKAEMWPYGLTECVCVVGVLSIG